MPRYGTMLTIIQTALVLIAGLALLKPASSHARPAQPANASRAQASASSARDHASLAVQPGPGGRWRHGSEEIVLVAKPGGDIDISVSPRQLIVEKDQALVDKDEMIAAKDQTIAAQERRLRQQKADFQRFESQVRIRELAQVAKLGYSESPVRTRIHAPGPVQLSGHKLARSGGRAVLLLDLVNPSQAAQTIRAIELRAGNRGQVTPHAVYIGDAEQHAGTNTVLAAESTTVAAIVVERAGRLEAPLRLSLTMQDESGAASESEAWFFPIEDMPPENVGKMSLHVQGIYGAIWLGQEVVTMAGSRQDLEPTSLKGLGVRLAYGLTARLSFEAEVMGASSGEADFPDVTVIDGQMTRTGDVYRSAVLGRVQGGLLMRFGEETFRPLVRLGLGLQGASQSAEIVGADGVRMDGPEVPSAFEGIVLLGTGLDIQLGQHFALGFTLSAALNGLDELRTIETGFHLAYGWKP